MTTSTPNSHILVGVDGSTSALHALTWAGAEAQRRNLPLTLVHVIDHSSLGQGYNLGASASFFQHLETDGAEFLSQAKDHVYALHPNVEVSTVKATGRPVPVLVELSRNALMTVLGSSGLGGFTGMMAGSVSVSLTAKGHSPVTARWLSSGNRRCRGVDRWLWASTTPNPVTVRPHGRSKRPQCGRPNWSRSTCGTTFRRATCTPTPRGARWIRPGNSSVRNSFSPSPGRTGSPGRRGRTSRRRPAQPGCRRPADCHGQPWPR